MILFAFVMVLAVINIRTGKGIAANAGHMHPVLKRSGGEYELIRELGFELSSTT